MFVKMTPEEIELLSFVKNHVILDGVVKSLELETPQGPILLSFEQYGSGLTVSKPKPDQFEKRYVVQGTVKGVPIVAQNFKNKHDADRLSLTLGEDVTVEEKEVNITKNPDTPLDDFPF